MVNTPLLIVTPYSVTLEAASAWMVLLVLVTVPLPFSARVPPFVASRVPVLVTAPGPMLKSGEL
ncbi:MAG TPA: hypothetical protein VMQ17_25085 [Candidatus Sulfotelmatobacter sp.]|nr:hypothetical protein [Candidatus Sulfotelmatobacter sp.]